MEQFDEPGPLNAHIRTYHAGALPDCMQLYSYSNYCTKISDTADFHTTIYNNVYASYNYNNYILYLAQSITPVYSSTVLRSDPIYT